MLCESQSIFVSIVFFYFVLLFALGCYVDCVVLCQHLSFFLFMFRRFFVSVAYFRVLSWFFCACYFSDLLSSLIFHLISSVFFDLVGLGSLNSVILVRFSFH